MNFRKRTVSGLLAAVIFAAAIPFYVKAAPAQGVEAEPVVVVIDPGHGGTNIGGQIPGMDEKNATLVTALAMKEELEKYEGVTVYLTRYGDQDMSLSDRPRAAAAVGADFFFSIHYNKAVPNRLYGAEVWIPSLGENYARGYACGDLILNELCDTYGLYRRGIKTKVNDRGTDYYGVIKYATELGIPSMIIEHCHIDNEADFRFFNSPEKLQLLGAAGCHRRSQIFWAEIGRTGRGLFRRTENDCGCPRRTCGAGYDTAGKCGNRICGEGRWEDYGHTPGQ